MLKFIRRNAAAMWVKMMFLAIVLVFIIGFGIGGYLGGAGTVPFAAKVNGQRIEPADAERAYESMLRLYQNLYKENFRPEMAEALDLRGNALDQLIRMTLLRQEAERIGLRVSDNAVRDQIATNQAFPDDGRFDRDLYVRVLRSNRVTPAEFEASTREQLRRNPSRTMRQWRIMGGPSVMNIGDKLRIRNLDYSYVWSMASISDPGVIAGAGDGYFAFTSGTATLTMTGDPTCYSLTPPCLMPSILYTITVIVQ